ncbi:MAG: hypothetical protein ABID54_00165 [Pseudomonadota bacterium]
MTQNATSVLDNVKRSVEKFLRDNLETAESLKISWEGYPFESGATAAYEWIQPRLLGFNDPSWQPKASSNTRGNTASVLLNTNCFVNKENITASNRHYVLRDTVNKHLYSGVSIPLRDYVGGTTRPWACLMVVAGITTDTAIPNENWLQYNYTVKLEWLREWKD